jgi:hypothetical protein
LRVNETLDGLSIYAYLASEEGTEEKSRILLEGEEGEAPGALDRWRSRIRIIYLLRK